MSPSIRAFTVRNSDRTYVHALPEQHSGASSTGWSRSVLLTARERNDGIPHEERNLKGAVSMNARPLGQTGITVSEIGLGNVRRRLGR
jgi:hypothetical protein